MNLTYNVGEQVAVEDLQGTINSWLVNNSTITGTNTSNQYLAVDSSGNWTTTDQLIIDNIGGYWSTTIDPSIIYSPEIKQNNNENKEDTKESTNMFDNFTKYFGACDSSKVQMSPYGIAFYNSTQKKWKTYNPEKQSIVDVTGFTYKLGSKFLYQIPVAIKDLKINDIILEEGVVPAVIQKIITNESNDMTVFKVLGIEDNKIYDLIPEENMFGFSYMIKVVPLFDLVGAEMPSFNATPTADTPFGNLWPLIIFGNDDSGMSDMFKSMMMMKMFNK